MCKFYNLTFSCNNPTQNASTAQDGDYYYHRPNAKEVQREKY